LFKETKNLDDLKFNFKLELIGAKECESSIEAIYRYNHYEFNV